MLAAKRPMMNAIDAPTAPIILKYRVDINKTRIIPSTSRAVAMVSGPVFLEATSIDR